PSSGPWRRDPQGVPVIQNGVHVYHVTIKGSHSWVLLPVVADSFLIGYWAPPGLRARRGRITIGPGRPPIHGGPPIHAPGPPPTPAPAPRPRPPGRPPGRGPAGPRQARPARRPA